MPPRPSPPQRKKAAASPRHNRGTFLVVDGNSYNVSNLVHASTERIPDEVTIEIRTCAWERHLYPRLQHEVDCIMMETTAVPRDTATTTASNSSSSSSPFVQQSPPPRQDQHELVAKRHEQNYSGFLSSPQSSSQDDSESDDTDKSENDNSSGTSSCSSSSSSPSSSASDVPSSKCSFGRHAFDALSWMNNPQQQQQHESSLASSIHWTPQQLQKAEILKQFCHHSGAQLPGALAVDDNGVLSTRTLPITSSTTTRHKTMSPPPPRPPPLTNDDSTPPMQQAMAQTTGSMPGAVRVEWNGILPRYQEHSSAAAPRHPKLPRQGLERGKMQDSKPSPTRAAEAASSSSSTAANVLLGGQRRQDRHDDPSSLVHHYPNGTLMTEQRQQQQRFLSVVKQSSYNNMPTDDNNHGLYENDALYHQQQMSMQDAASAACQESWSSEQLGAAASALERSCEISSCQSPSPPPPQQTQQRMVQVTNDLELPLHGARETTEALETGNVVTVVCVVCRATLRCINIARYVLCPECKCLTPLENDDGSRTHGAVVQGGGVGLGLLSAYDQSYRVGVT